MVYDTILVPGYETLRSSTLERLEAFASAGGKLIFLGHAPKYENAVLSCRGKKLYQISQQVEFSEDAILSALEYSRTLDIRQANGQRTDFLLHQLRRDGNDRWLFLAHGVKPTSKDVPEPQKIRLTMDGCWHITKYDTITGQIAPVNTTIRDGKTILETVLYDLDSLLLKYSPIPTGTPEETVQKDYVTIPVPQLVSYQLDEPNVYLMDKAAFALGNGPYYPETELLRADNILRDLAGFPSREFSVAQPWTIPEEQPGHTVALRFHVHCQEAIPDVKLALEDATLATILFNGTLITAAPDGWFTDKSIETIPIGTLQQGENIIEIHLPFGRRTDIEWCYLLGSFGVQVWGEHRILTAPQPLLGFDDVTKQGLAHYGGNITYQIPIETHRGNIRITVPHYTGTAVRVELDGQKGYVAYAPYQLELDSIAPGSHTLKLTLLGNRFNCFGPVHLADPKHRWLGPDCWRTQGSRWTESYRLKPLGIFSAPIIEESI